MIQTHNPKEYKGKTKSHAKEKEGKLIWFWTSKEKGDVQTHNLTTLLWIDNKRSF